MSSRSARVLAAAYSFSSVSVFACGYGEDM